MINQSPNQDANKAAPSATPAAASSLARFSTGLRSKVKTDMEAVIFVGIQGCGKSSLFGERFSGTHLHINLDTLKTRKREQSALEVILREGKPFVVDNTNPSIEVRKNYIELAKAHNYRVVCYYFDVPLKEALARNAKRTGKAKVPVPAIMNTYRHLQPPAFAEGFDEIFKVTLSPEGRCVIEPLKHP